LKDPFNYPDDNHKPEMAIAITEVKAFMDFCFTAEILKRMKRFSNLSSTIFQKYIKSVEVENKE
jgi:mannose-6-phosphate isomerase